MGEKKGKRKEAARALWISQSFSTRTGAERCLSSSLAAMTAVRGAQGPCLPRSRLWVLPPNADSWTRLQLFMRRSTGADGKAAASTRLDGKPTILHAVTSWQREGKVRSHNSARGLGASKDEGRRVKRAGELSRVVNNSPCRRWVALLARGPLHSALSALSPDKRLPLSFQAAPTSWPNDGSLYRIFFSSLRQLVRNFRLLPQTFQHHDSHSTYFSLRSSVQS